MSRIEADIFIIAKRHGVTNVAELDLKVKEGVISEKDGYEDYFALDNLESEREKIKDLLEKI